MINITINGKDYEVAEQVSVLEATRSLDIYIPSMCSHPDLEAFNSLELSEEIYQGKKVYKNDEGAKIQDAESCGLCKVEIDGYSEPVSSCDVIVGEGMKINTGSDELKNVRQKNFIPIIGKHPHCCLTCAQREGCPMTESACTSGNVTGDICCEISSDCEFMRVSDFVGIAAETPKFVHPEMERITDANLFMRDYNLCISCGRCVRACQQLRNVFALGAVVNDGKLVIGTVKGEHLSDADCRFCGACAEVCPTGAIQDIGKPRLSGKEELVPCQANCPADVDIPDYLSLIAGGDPQKSAEVIASKLSFPHSLGKMCFHPCETDCRRNDLSSSESGDSDSISIRQAKDYAMSNSDVKSETPESSTGKNVAIIGGGPAGLTTAFYLSLNGHSVTVYEKEEHLGGMLKYGIPDYRLDDETLGKDLSRILDSGIIVKSNIEIGKDILLNDLLNDFDSVYLSTGLSKSRHLPIQMPDNNNIYYGIEFLNKAMKREYSDSYFENKNVIVIGGGNVSTDAARTAVRLGAESTKIICLEKEEEMPAYRQEIIEGLDEGILIENSWGISNISGLEELKIDVVKCSSVFDESGKFSPQYDDSITKSMNTDVIIICIGQSMDLSVLAGSEDKNLKKSNLINVTAGHSMTNVRGLFAGGDMVSGPASVIDAVAMGKRSAEEIDSFLGGKGEIRGTKSLDVLRSPKIGIISGFDKVNRINTELNPPEHRKKNFTPIEKCYTHTMAANEASRCLQCDLRLNISSNLHPPDEFEIFDSENINKIENEGGVVQLLNSDKEVFLIKGSSEVRNTLEEFLDDGKEAAYFICEYDPLYTKKESELVQSYLQKHGEMPDSGDDLDDLF
jgi:formate dehydrogenase (NADP+) beta subunit